MFEFTSEKITDHITKINTPGVYCYLVEGNDAAVVIDTGWGIFDLRSYVESLTDKPYKVLVSHGHIDHVNGSGLFEEVYLNPKDAELAEQEYDPVRTLKNFEMFKMNNLEIQMTDFNPRKTTPFLEMHDGDVFELGGYTVRAVSVPGHTAGMTMFFLEQDRIMFYGDGCTKHTFMFPNGCQGISTYLKGLKHLKEFDGMYDTVIRSHNVYTAPLCILDENIALCERILMGTDAHQKTEVTGETVYAAAEMNERWQRRDGGLSNIFYKEEFVY